MTYIKLYDKVKEKCPSPLCLKLINKLLETSFRYDPASYKYHHVYKYGLMIHSLELYDELCNLVNENKELIKDISNETLFLIAFGHDIEKTGSYKFNFSTKSYDYKFHKMFGFTHGEYGFNKLEEYLGDELKQLKDYELIKICIYGHMGDYGRTNKEKKYYHDHLNDYPLLWLTHQADMKSCELNGKDYQYLLEIINEKT